MSGFGGIVRPDRNLRGAREQPGLAKRWGVEEHTTSSLVDILDHLGAPSVIEYLSLDAEGEEERILGHFAFDRYDFRAMTIERPSPRLRAKLRRVWRAWRQDGSCHRILTLA